MLPPPKWTHVGSLAVYVAATYNYGYLHALLHGLFDVCGILLKHGGVDAVTLTTH